MLRLVEKKEVIVVVYRQQTNCTLGKKLFCFLGCAAAHMACSKFCHHFVLFASVTPIFIVYFVLGTADFKTSNNQEFFFTPCFHDIFLFFFQFRMNNQLINILFVLNSSFSFSEISHLQDVLPKLSLQCKNKGHVFRGFSLEAVEAVVFSRVKDHRRLLRMMLLLQVHLTNSFFSSKHLKFHDWIFSS